MNAHDGSSSNSSTKEGDLLSSIEAIRSAKKENYYFYAIIEFLSNHRSKKEFVKYEKVEIKANTPASEVGKYKITFADGSTISQDSISKYCPNFTWPSYPLVCDTESDAKVFKRSWDNYLKIHSKVSLR